MQCDARYLIYLKTPQFIGFFPITLKSLCLNPIFAGEKALRVPRVFFPLIIPWGSPVFSPLDWCSWDNFAGFTPIFHGKSRKSFRWFEIFKMPRCSTVPGVSFPGQEEIEVSGRLALNRQGFAPPDGLPKDGEVIYHFRGDLAFLPSGKLT